MSDFDSTAPTSLLVSSNILGQQTGFLTRRQKRSEGWRNKAYGGYAEFHRRCHRKFCFMIKKEQIQQMRAEVLGMYEFLENFNRSFITLGSRNYLQLRNLLIELCRIRLRAVSLCRRSPCSRTIVPRFCGTEW